MRARRLYLCEYQFLKIQIHEIFSHLRVDKSKKLHIIDSEKIIRSKRSCYFNLILKTINHLKTILP